MFGWRVFLNAFPLETQLRVSLTLCHMYSHGGNALNAGCAQGCWTHVQPQTLLNAGRLHGFNTAALWRGSADLADN